MNAPDKTMTWEDHQAWEQRWWGNCTNTFAEEAKQITYAHRMGLVVTKHPEFYETWPLYNLEGKSVVDIGGGPCSMLLKTWNGGRRLVVDPCEYPTWTQDRYDAAGIELMCAPGERRLRHLTFDEAWIYNVLQHVEDPEVIIGNALDTARLVRIFEWIDRGTGPGHPQSLSKKRLDGALRGNGKTEELRGENSCYGMCYYGAFRGNV